MKSISRFLLPLVLACAASPAWSAAPPVPAAPEGTVYAVTYVDVAAASIPQAIGLLRHYHDASAQAGSSSVDLYQELDRADHFVIMEQWASRAAFDAGKSGPEATQLLASLKPIESAPPDAHVFQGYSVGPIRPPGGGRAKVYGLSLFAVSPAKVADFDAVAKPFADMSRSDPAGMRFDILREEPPRQNQFLIVESWSDPEAAEAHRVTQHTLSFRDGLAPLLTSPFDDRFYGKFN